MKQKLKIKKGDKVVVITGKDKGKRGSVTKVFPELRRVIVAGVNVCKKHIKPSQTNPQGGIVSLEKAIHCSNVALLDPKAEVATKVGYKILTDGKKVRFSKKSGEIIDNA
jgi:large subunit ribosomal protein L24